MNRRKFLTSSVAATVSTGFMLSTPAKRLWAANKNDSVNLGFISCGGRAGDLANTFSKLEGVNVAGLCDPDTRRIEIMRHKFPKANACVDMRDLLSSEGIDAVVIATTNHWHCLAAIWAMEAGKDVYVEKPLSHSQWEGEQTVAAARQYNRICQVGTQQRSDPMQAAIKNFLHQEKAIGEIKVTRVNRYGVRGSIGRRDTPLEIDKDVAYDLWLGPAQDLPVFRKQLHYDWHWVWNTGAGEMGNWGVHVLDDVRNNVFQDKVTVPKRIIAGGGRFVWDDAGETPNVHFAYFDTGSSPVLIGLSNLPATPDEKRPASHPGPDSGYVVYCEGGRLEGQRGSAVAYDNDNQLIQRFKGNGGGGQEAHAQNFIEAVRTRNASMLNADVEVGHNSTGWCNLANIAWRVGGAFSPDQAREIDNETWQSLLSDTQEHLSAYDIKFDQSQTVFGPMLELDVDTQRFTGEHANLANRFIKREYRAGYEVPALV